MAVNAETYNCSQRQSVLNMAGALRSWNGSSCGFVHKITPSNNPTWMGDTRSHLQLSDLKLEGVCVEKEGSRRILRQRKMKIIKLQCVCLGNIQRIYKNTIMTKLIVSVL